MTDRERIVCLARTAVASGGCACGWGGQHRDDCAVGAYEEAVSDPEDVLRALAEDPCP